MSPEEFDRWERYRSAMQKAFERNIEFNYHKPAWVRWLFGHSTDARDEQLVTPAAARQLEEWFKLEAKVS